MPPKKKDKLPDPDPLRNPAVLAALKAQDEAVVKRALEWRPLDSAQFVWLAGLARAQLEKDKTLVRLPLDEGGVAIIGDCHGDFKSTETAIMLAKEKSKR